MPLLSVFCFKISEVGVKLILRIFPNFDFQLITIKSSTITIIHS